MIGLTIYRRPIHQQRLFPTGPVTIGSSQGGSGHFQCLDTDLSDMQLEISWVDKAGQPKANIKNLGKTIVLENGIRIHRGADREMELPVSIWVGETVVRVFDPIQPAANDELLTELDVQQADLSQGLSLPNGLDSSPGAATLVAWFNCFAKLQSTIAGSAEFYHEAAKSVFDPGGLDACLILKRNELQWSIESSYVPHPEQEIAYRQDLLNRVINSGRPIFHATNESDQIQGQQPSIVIAPVLDQAGDVQGAVYGIRSQHRKNSRKGIRPLEAHFCNLVAQSVATAEMRLQKETEIARTNILLQQAFPPSVAIQLQNDPGILDGQQKPVSVMFCDVRDFSEISNRLAPKSTYQMIADIMDSWTNIVLGHGGTIIDYYGDGLSAFWNAPLPVDDYCKKTVECALDIRQSMPELNELWTHLVGRPLRIGIGISSGTAQVGNCGSRVRIKYGPHGSVVNLASRIENATKAVGLPILMNADTADKVKESFIVRRMIKANLKGFSEGIDLFEPIRPVAGVNYFKMVECYEAALESLESQQWEQASQELANISCDFATDPGVRFLSEMIQKRIETPIDLNAISKSIDQTEENRPGLSDTIRLIPSDAGGRT